MDVRNAGAGQPLKRTQTWKRELHILRRDGLVKYLRVLRSVRRFNRSVRRLP
jgi:hypothetical protein